MAFSAINKAPGVYIDEVQLPGPIAGVGTSTAAFVGPARRGPIDKPILLTNWTQFVNTFGVQDDFGPYISDPPVYVAHAVRGFFDNGGTACYFVRAGIGAQASLELKDGDGSPAARSTLVVTAKREGTAGNNIEAEVNEASIVASPVDAVREEITVASASNNQATVAAASDAAKFRPGDIVVLSEGANTDRVTVDRTSDKTITFRQTLTHTYTAGKLRIADLNPGQQRVRIADITGIEPGSYISIITDGTTTEKQVVQAVDRANKAVTLAQGLTNLFKMGAGDPKVQLKTLEFTLIIHTPGVETYSNLSMDPRHSRYFANIVDSPSVDVIPVDPPNPTRPPANLPAPLAATPLGGGKVRGKDDEITKIQTTDYKRAIDALEKEDEVNILCVPDSVGFKSQDVQDIRAYMIAHCERMQDRFAILDPQPIDPESDDPLSDIEGQRGLVSSDRGFGALYYPQIKIANPVAEGRIMVPPSGHIAGVYARVDNARGVHKAPANETIRGVLALEHVLTDDEQGPLNEAGINVIRSFPGSGIRVWGARTIAPKDRTQWRYVNVRRLLLFIEESIQEGTQFAVFEPNNLSLWGQLKRQVTDFLTRVWRDGALFGATAEEAFRVRIDEELNPRDLRPLGQLVIEVIVVPTTLAEFVVFRIISDTTGKALIKE